MKTMRLQRFFNEGKKLRVFDFDDTIVTTNSKIYVTHKNGKKRTLTPAQFAKYVPKPGDEFNFSDFDTSLSPRDPRLIKWVAKILQRVVKSSGEREVVILTARAAAKPVEKFIRGLGYRNIKVVALGSGNPQMKADWIEDRIVYDDYDDIYFIDDSIKNVNTVKTMLSKYPNIKYRVQHVKHNVLESIFVK